MTNPTAPDIIFRQDITCPKTGEMIPLDKFSVSKWSDDLYLVHCPTCRVMHRFNPIPEQKS